MPVPQIMARVEVIQLVRFTVEQFVLVVIRVFLVLQILAHLCHTQVPGVLVPQEVRLPGGPAHDAQLNRSDFVDIHILLRERASDTTTTTTIQSGAALFQQARSFHPTLGS